MNKLKFLLKQTTINGKNLRFLPLILLFLSLILIQNKVQATISCSCNSVSDSLQLVDLHSQTNGTNWTNEWNLNLPMDTWFGVVLSPERCVEELNLYTDFNAYAGNGLTGTLPSLSLPNLTRLVLQGNNINGLLPDFSGLPALEVLNLNGNNLSGTLPDFADNPNLSIVAMDANPITGTLPDFPNSPELTSLSFYFCELSGSIPNFSQTPELRELFLGQNELSGEIPDFDNLPELRILNLDSNELEGDIFDFSYLPKLEELFIGNNNLTGNIIDLQNVPALKTLELAGNNLTGTIPDFSGLPLLENLRLGFNSLEGSIPDFSQLPLLNVIDISRANMTGTLPEFTACPLLEKISLIGNELTGAVPDYSFLPLITLRLQENLLDKLPDLSALNNWGNFVTNGFVVNDNKFTFEDILPNMSAANSGFWRYAPQDSIGENLTEILVPGSDYTIDLMIDENISNNTYDWYKDGVFLSTTSVNKLTLNNLQNTDEGVYTCLVRNAGATDLTLISRPVTIILCVQATDAQATNTGAYCTGDAISLLGNIGTAQANTVTYEWTGPDNYTSDQQNPTDATQAGVYTFIVILDNCPSLPATTSVEVFATPEQANITANDTVLCTGESLQLSTAELPDVSYNWTGPNGYTADTSNPVISNNASSVMSGTYFLYLSNNACAGPISSIEIEVLESPDPTFSYPDVCEGEDGFPLSVTTAGGLFSFAIPPSDAATIDANTGEINNLTVGETYSISYTLNGDSACPAVATQNFSVLTEPLIENVTSECAPNLQTYSVIFNTDAEVVNASLGAVSQIADNNWRIDNIPAGTDIEITAGISSIHCETVDNIIAPICECPIIQAPVALVSDLEACEGEVFPNFTVSVAENYTANWYNQANTGELLAENTLTFTPNEAGIYYVETYDPITQCISETRTAVSLQTSVPPQLNIEEFNCDTLNATYSITFFSDSDELEITAGTLSLLSENQYIVENIPETEGVNIRVQNGACEVTEEVPAPNCYCDRIASLISQSPTCFGDQDGHILINQGINYTSSVDITINGELIQRDRALPYLIPNLTAGVYDLKIEDDNACAKSMQITLDEPRELLLDLGLDQEITSGERVTLDIQTNVEQPILEWQMNTSSLSCTDCLNPILQPDQTTFYPLTLRDSAGCEISDLLRIFVNEDIPVYAPEAFSPDNDGINDYFTLYADLEKVQQIKQLSVFDRWGNQLFSQVNMPINDESKGWDGSFRGKILKPDVYVWFAEVELANQETVTMQGSISLLR